jgi:hypothetical protein
MDSGFDRKRTGRWVNWSRLKLVFRQVDRMGGMEELLDALEFILPRQPQPKEPQSGSFSCSFSPDRENSLTNMHDP